MTGSDPAVGPEPGETEPGSVPAALLSEQPAGRRAAQPQEPPRRGQPALQVHAGTPWCLLRVVLPRSGKTPPTSPPSRQQPLQTRVLIRLVSSGVQQRRGDLQEGGRGAVLSEGSGRTEETLPGRQTL